MSVKVIVLRNYGGAWRLPFLERGLEYYMRGIAVQTIADVPTALEIRTAFKAMQKQIDSLQKQLTKLQTANKKLAAGKKKR